MLSGLSEQRLQVDLVQDVLLKVLADTVLVGVELERGWQVVHSVDPKMKLRLKGDFAQMLCEQLAVAYLEPSPLCDLFVVGGETIGALGLPRCC